MTQYRNYRSYPTPRRPRNNKGKRLAGFLILIFSICAVITAYLLLRPETSNETEATPAMALAKTYEKPAIQADLLEPNPYSRPQTPIEEVNGVVVHYVGNPGTSAKANRNYFNGLAESKATYASSHFIIDIDGTIIQCIPLDEMSYASNDRNKDTISIEVCHPDETGEFTAQSYKALVSLTKWLCSEYELDSNDVIRHYDVTGKLCPLYYVEHEDAWLKFKKDVFK